MAVTIILISPTGQKHEITFSDDEIKTATVAYLKDIASRICEIPVDAIRLEFAARILGDDWLLSDYGITHMSTIRAVRRLRGGGEETLGMGEREGRNASKEQLSSFDATEESSCCIS